jgi:antitoxin MazE
MTTRTRIVPIGNSQGIRIPKAVLQESGLHGEVELDVADGTIVIRSPRPESLRGGWEKEFERMTHAGDDELIEPTTPTEWEETGWTW